ncbi:MAG: RcnB family protein [bacterium]
MRRLSTAVLALALLGTTPALAADYNHDRDYRHQSDYRDNNRHDYNRHDSNRHHWNRHHWNRGQKIGRSWFLYTPVDWRRHHFRAPRYGYHWIYADGYFLLVDRNGFVIEVVAG